VLSLSKKVSLLVILLANSSPTWSARNILKKEPVVPPGVDFVRSLDVDGYLGATNRGHMGMQSGRVRLRFLDPDVNAFVGTVVGVNHFNQDLRIGDPQGPDTAATMGNFGGVFGLVRGRHLWELDLMGTLLSNRLGFATAIVGEHHLTERLMLYHRTEVNIYTVDKILDADQGFYWMWKPWLGASIGYRWFTSEHMDRSGPHIGFRYYFESPKIPLIFPSIG
jgi:hypothetical protein